MDIIRKTGYFGNTLFEQIEVNVNRNGLKIEKPFGGTFVVYSYDDDTFHDASEYPDGIIKKKSGMFSKKVNECFLIIFINDATISGKGFMPKMAFDHTFGKISVDMKIRYDISVSYAPGRVKQMMGFMRSNNILKFGDAEKIIDNLKPLVNTAFKTILGKYVDEYDVVDFENNNMTLSNQIVELLNSSHSNVYDNGFIIKNIVFEVSDDYIYHELKKRVQHNQMITNDEM